MVTQNIMDYPEVPASTFHSLGVNCTLHSLGVNCIKYLLPSQGELRKREKINVHSGKP